MLWNPRQEDQRRHLLVLADGTLHPITPVGEITLRQLRLNRPELVTFRLDRVRLADSQRQWERYEQVLALLELLSRQQADLMAQQRELFQRLREREGHG
jgi:hypothetical protein